jgi:hypothetical protein
MALGVGVSGYITRALLVKNARQERFTTPGC